MVSAERVTEFKHSNPFIQNMGEEVSYHLDALPLYRQIYDLSPDEVEQARSLVDTELDRLGRIVPPITTEYLAQIATTHSAHLDDFFNIVTKGEKLPAGAKVVHCNPANEWDL